MEKLKRFVTGENIAKISGWTIYDFFFEFDLLIEKLEKEAKRVAKLRKNK